MRRWLILITTHLVMLAIGFAGGIYALPILTAPRAPDTAALQNIATETLYAGRLARNLKGSDLLHWGEGVNDGQKARKDDGDLSAVVLGSLWPFLLRAVPVFGWSACSCAPACHLEAGARGACQTRVSGTAAMRQHGEEPPFDRRARAGNDPWGVS